MEVLLILPLISLIGSDFRKRHIRLYTLLLFAVLLWSVAFYRYGIYVVVFCVFTNSGILLLWWGGILVWNSVRHRRLRLSLKGLIGTGDILFLFILTPVFTFRNFLFFLIGTGLLGLLYHSLFLKSRPATIPLVSMMGIGYLFYVFIDLICSLC